MLLTRGASLEIPALQKILWHDELGTWALDAATITFVWNRMHQDRPRTIIECGAGTSTLILAKYLATVEPSIFPRLYSIEQDAGVKRGIENRLSQHGLGSYATIIHSPVSDQGGYQFDIQEIYDRLESRRADWLLIDGPAGPDGCRAQTLPQLARFCRPGARWFLDDSFRDGELKILHEWSRLPGILVEGILPIGKGLGTGTISKPHFV